MNAEFYSVYSATICNFRISKLQNVYIKTYNDIFHVTILKIIEFNTKKGIGNTEMALDIYVDKLLAISNDILRYFYFVLKKKPWVI